MRFSHICAMLLIVPCCAGALKDEKKMVVEHSKPIANDSKALGTTMYKTTPAEEKLANTWDIGKDEIPYSFKAESLANSDGKWVGWFGIVREVKEDKGKKQTILLVEAKYFDGMIDLHQQIVSIYGPGDFRVVIKGIDHKIKPLSLVRVCGTARIPDKKSGEKDDKLAASIVPAVAAEYVRVWDWGLFAFMHYGKDGSNPKWVALRKLAEDKIYSSRPDNKYYEELLGKR